MSWLTRIEECNRHDLRRFVPLVVDDQRIGNVRRDRVATLLAAGPHFAGDDSRIELCPTAIEARTRAFAEIARQLEREGSIRRLTGELYGVAHVARAQPLALVDRAAVSWFGIPSAGVHVNGFVRTTHGIEMWVAERSTTKATYAGMLDNMVAGGQPHGLSLRENVMKECAEEAGIDAQLSSRAVAVGVVSYIYEDHSGLKPDTMYCFDLELPDAFAPTCVDGEVGRFLRLPIDEVAAIVAGSDRFKFNCNLVVIDFLVRHGLLDIEDPDHPAVVAGLRRSHPPCRGIPDRS